MTPLSTLDIYRDTCFNAFNHDTLSILVTATASTVGVDEGGVDSTANEGEKVVSKEAMEARRKREAALEAEIGKYIFISYVLHCIHLIYMPINLVRYPLILPCLSVCRN